MDLNDRDVTIDCPHCKDEIVVKVLEITNHHTVDCPKCCKSVDLTANDPLAKLGDEKTHRPFEGLDNYIRQAEGKKKSKT